MLHILPFFVPFRDFNPLEYMTKLGQRVTMNRGGRRGEKERKRDRPFRNFISTRLHLRDSFLNVFSFKMLSDPVAVVKNDRSKSDRLYFAEKWNFILSWNSLTNAFFIVTASKPGILVTATNSARHIFIDEFYW